MGKKRPHDRDSAAASEERAKRQRSSIDVCYPFARVLRKLTRSVQETLGYGKARRTHKVTVERVENARNGSKESNGGPSGGAKRLAYLARLSSEIANDPQLTKECREIAGDEIVLATLNLGKVFRSKQSVVAFLDQGLPAYDKIESDISGPSIPGQVARVERRSALLPDLPPILDPSFARTPFIHRWRTADKDRAPSADGNYERLEFLGDAYVELIASRLILPRFPQMSAGRLSQTRELLVKNETLAQFALAYKFDELAEIPTSHKEGRGDTFKQWNKILGDMFEAYVAALILSDTKNGFATAEAWLFKLWAPKLPDYQDHNPPENPTAKVDLAKKILTRGAKIDYRDEEQVKVNKEGKVWFKIGVYFTGFGWENQHLGSGKGLSKAEAGIRAAMEALLNPLTAQIGAVKRDFDDKVKLQREQQKSDDFQSEG